MLAATFGSLDALQNAALEDLTAVPDIGETTAQNILDYLQARSRRTSLSGCARLA